MSIKNIIKRLENQVSKNSDKNTMTFVIPYTHDEEKTKEIKRSIIVQFKLEKSDAQIIYILDFSATAQLSL